MTKTGMYVGLDIGTSSVKVVVSEFVEGQMNIIGVGDAKSEGLSRGIIVDIDKTVESIKNAVKQAEAKAGIQIKNVTVGLPANLLEIEKCEGMIAVSNTSKEITDEDVVNVASASMVRSITPERQIISLIPQEFKVDGFEGIKDPRGMLGVRLEMKGLLLTGPKTTIHNVKTCVKKAGLTVAETVVTPLALAETILTDGEKDFGTIVIDLGAGQTNVSVMYENELKFTHVEQEGGEFITKDISLVLNTSINNAEALKINYGDAYPARTSTEETFPVDVIGQSQPVMIDEHYLSEIIEARLEQIFNKVKRILNEIDALSLPGGIVLTGGVASLPGVVELAADVFENNVKLYVPNHMGLRNPIFANVIALVDYSAQLNDVYNVAKAAITGEKAVVTQPNFSKEQTATKREIHEKAEPVQVEKATNAEQAKEVTKPVEKESALNKVKGLFSNIFE